MSAGVLRRRCATAIAGSLAVLVGEAQPAGAAFPGDNGRIYFERQSGQTDSDVYSIAPDGTNLELVKPSAGDPAVAPDGETLAYASLVSGVPQIFVSKPGGPDVQLTDGPIAFSPAWSPDGDTIAYTRIDGAYTDIFSIPATGGTPAQLTTDPGADQDPAFSPDGETIAFTRESGTGGIMTMPADGGDATLLTTGTSPSFSADGSKIIFSDLDPETFRNSIWTIEPDGSDRTELVDGANFFQPAFSPRGDRIVYSEAPESDGEATSTPLVVSDADGTDPIPITAPPVDIADGDADWAVAPSDVTCRGEQATLTGSDGADTLVGTAGRDVIAGLGGDDEVRAIGDRDIVCGGAGDDVLRAGGGADRISGGSGDDVLRGRSGKDRLRGGSGDDRLGGGKHRDVCRQGSGKGSTRGCERGRG